MGHVGGRIVNVCVVVATGVNVDGQREILDIDVGLSGVELVTPRCSPGAENAIAWASMKFKPSITTTHLGWDARHWPIPFVNVHRATVSAAPAPRSFPEAEHQPVVVILETRPESQLAGFSTAPERRNTVVNDVFVHATRFNHP